MVFVIFDYDKIRDPNFKESFVLGHDLIPAFLIVHPSNYPAILFLAYFGIYSSLQG